MSDNATAQGGSPPASTAVEPSRVLILDESEQYALLDALEHPANVARAGRQQAVYNHVAYGPEYWNATDEFVRTTFAKRRLEAEIRKLNARLTELDEQLVEEWTEAGRNKDGHEATGATLHLSKRVWAKLDVDTGGLSRDAADSLRRGVKAQLADRLQSLDEPELAGLVKPDVNLQSLSAIFAERVKEYDEEQRMLPGHERVPRAAADFLPDELRGLLVIDATPHVQVRA